MRHSYKILCSLLFSVSLVGCGGGTVSDADNDQVITVGDSIFDLSNEIQQNLEASAGQTFRKYTKSGAELNGGLIQSVYSQYAEAKSDNPNIETVVMDGAGNDILIPVLTLFDPYNCKVDWWEFGKLSSSCKNLINDLYVEAVTLLNQMDADGVDNVIYLGYYHTKDMPVNNLSALKQAVDYGDNKLAQACSYSTANCQFIDPRGKISNSDIKADGIHPTTSGSRKLADMIWPKLQPLL